MIEERCTKAFVPWLLAWQHNWLPDVDAKHELEDIGDDKMMCFLASHKINSKCLFIYDMEWGRMTGQITLWHGAVENIPAGWHLCDGTAGTVDLRNKFIVGAGDTYDPGDSAPTNVAADAGIAYYALCYIQKIS